MANHNVPSAVAASVKVLTDAVRDTFGAAIIVIGFFGMAFVGLSFGFSNLSSESRFFMMCIIIVLMFLILIALFGLRICNPSGLGGPPSPSTKDVTFTDTSVS